MKKILAVIVALILTPSAYAYEDIKLDAEPLKLAINTNLSAPESEPVQAEEDLTPEFDLFDTPIEKENKFYTSLYNNITSVSLNTVKPILSETLTQYFDKGPIESLHEWGVIQMNMSENFNGDGNVQNLFRANLINLILDGQFRGGKEGFRIMLDPSPQDTRNFFQPFIQDLYVESKRIPHHTILVGNSRPAVGHEGSQSPYTLPLWYRSQISRNFGTIRKFGLRVHGDYSLIDYDLGGLSSDTYFTEFFPGAEFDGWVNIKPLGLTDGKYGKLTLGGGIVAGGRNAKDFFVVGTYLGYEYKKFWMRAEYANANGSNGATGFSDKQRQGWYTTIGYRVNDRVELVARYDEFDPDKNINRNNSREYSAGINYYFKGKAFTLILNYVFCQFDNRQDSHKIILGLQVSL